MKSRLIALLSIALCALVTSCYPPYPPLDQAGTTGPAPAPVQQKKKNTPTAGDRAQRQLDAARERLKREEARAAREARDNATSNNSGPSNPIAPPTPTTYRYASKVEGKEGFVHNPYTQNQVDVRGIPSGTLVRDPHDSNPAHKFRVP